MPETTRPLPDIPPDMTPQEVPQRLPEIMRKLGNWVAQEIQYLRRIIQSDPRLSDDRIASGLRARQMVISLDKSNRPSPGDVLFILPSGLDADWGTFGSVSPSGGSPSITGQALTRTNDTNVTVTLGGSPATALLAATSMTLGWSGTLAIARGGTAASTALGAINNLSPLTTKGDLLGFDSGNNVRKAVGADGFVLTADAASTAGFKWAAASSGNEFADNVFRVYDDGDNTKKVALQVASVTTGTTRTWTVQDQSGTVGLLEATGQVWAQENEWTLSQILAPITPSQSTPTPARPASTKVKVFGDGGLGLTWPSIWPEVGKLQRVQGSLGQVGARIIRPGATTVPQTLGMVLGTAVGTVSHPTVANTTYKTSLRRIQVLSAVGANSVATIFEASLGPWPGNAAGLGGFYHCSRGCLTLSTTLGHYGIMGLRNSTSSFGSATAPSNITDAVVLGAEQLAGVGDTTYQIFHNDNVGGAVKTDTGIALDTPVQFEVWIAPNGSTMYCRVTRLDDETVDQFEYNANSNLPRNSLFYAFHIHACTGADTTQAATATLYNAITESPV